MEFVSFYGGVSNQVASDIGTVISDNYSLDSMHSGSYSKRGSSSCFFPEESAWQKLATQHYKWCAN